MSRSAAIALAVVFIVSIAFIWASVDPAAAFVAFWFGIIGFGIGRDWPPRDRTP